MAQSTEQPASAAAADGEIREYKIHASTKYLELTRQKLELARLPREIPDANSTSWWNPKPALEPLIDYWLEKFFWKEHEREINQSVPQFKISFQTSATEAPTRIHFIHARSRHANAVPLLLIPPFPFTNLSFRHITETFTDPSDATVDQPFHLVMPSLPGLGFSDSLPDNMPVIPKTSEMLDTLMKRLGYEHYIASSSGSVVSPEGGVDWKIINLLAATYPDSCLGVHLISPPLKAPKALKSPVEWMKLTLAKTLQTSIFGYTKEDIVTLQKNERERAEKTPFSNILALGPFAAGAYDPNTLAYALCDSPTGLLVFFLALFRELDSDKEYTSLELVTTTKLTWLPGPEGTLRLLADSYLSGDDLGLKPSRKPKASITVFVADDEAGQSASNSAQQSAPSASAKPYACPSWGKQHYDVVWTGRVRGKQGLLAWERPQVIAEGARNLAKALIAVDKRLQAPVNGAA
ncbi:alpha/beta-hydrolase [Trichoderma citrinoviride]|uniref:Alpha/beta-hydrolase n=1 Tax=Trichoderma citrinoviride TaxID=58853 RepID=A0A2T4BJI8_9HYPO|nr:alpha/beta-hydrolase [Trichoderma citrinoviride]PTB69482.1 alpha/beta-hydrolase [Trichoderma citrinoviride]